jgi:hypothetical protein
MHYIWQCPKVQEFWQQVGRWLEKIFEIPIQLNIENTVFNTNMDEFPYEIILNNYTTKQNILANYKITL